MRFLKSLPALALLTGLLVAPPAPAAQFPIQFEESVYVQGLNAPVSIEYAPDGRLFVCEKGGTLRVIDSSGVLLANPFLTVSVSASSERGLLGVAFDPNFATNRYVYVYYTRAASPIKNRISRFTASASDPNVAEAGSEVVILDDIASDAGNHNGGAIHFGLDGKLYVGIGDGGANAQNSQDLSTLSGKLLRIDPASYPGSIVPADNPFVDVAGARGEIWAYGLRNPFSFAVQPGTGRILINDVGENTWEEVNEGIRGANYGWPNSEGPTNTPGITSPIYAYNHNGSGASIAGGVFYQGRQFPASYRNNYFLGDFIQGFVRRLAPPDYTQVTNFGSRVIGVVDLDVAPDGSLLYVSISSGRIYQVRSRRRS